MKSPVEIAVVTAVTAFCPSLVAAPRRADRRPRGAVERGLSLFLQWRKRRTTTSSTAAPAPTSKPAAPAGRAASSSTASSQGTHVEPREPRVATLLPAAMALLNAGGNGSPRTGAASPARAARGSPVSVGQPSPRQERADGRARADARAEQRKTTTTSVPCCCSRGVGRPRT